MAWLLRLTHPIHRMSRGLAYLAGLAALIMVLVGAYNAIARYLGKFLGMSLTSNALVELQWYLFSIIFLLGAPWALRHGAHVRVDVAYERYSPKGKAWLNLLGTLILLIPFCVMGIWTCWHFASESVSSREGSNDPDGLARWPIKAMVPAAFAALLLQGLAEVVHQVAFLLGQGPDPNAPSPDREVDIPLVPTAKSSARNTAEKGQAR